ncbi:MAG: CBS domain-containing protein [Acholeplasmataceae bacterium]|nr:CBS domain-containing protein [Acholeplasmataceae bacterium]
MNITSFLKPFYDLTLVYNDQTLSDALITMTKHRYTSIPVITRDQKYVGTLTEGDILHFVLQNVECLNSDNLDKYLVSEVKRHRDYDSVSVTATMPMLLSKASNENFVPVVDQNENFVGIITRKTLLDYFFEHNFLVL